MNISIFLMVLYIFLDTVAYSLYEFKNQNKFGGSIVFILALFMIVFVNICTLRFQ